jgi:hypothetical protein
VSSGTKRFRPAPAGALDHKSPRRAIAQQARNPREGWYVFRPMGGSLFQSLSVWVQAHPLAAVRGALAAPALLWLAIAIKRLRSVRMRQRRCGFA